ncbi:ATP-dependent DNA helicase, partial [Ameyamaea chiangmaiensis]|nr:ATP-dependent DNA helicase [Ameyamaea chiangmaiensis]
PAPDDVAPAATLLDGLMAPVDKTPNPSEVFLRHLRAQVLARARGSDRSGKAAQHATALECDLHPIGDDLSGAARGLGRALSTLADPLRVLARRLHERLDEDADTLDSASRGRIEAAIRTLHRRALSRLDGWVAMLEAVDAPRPDGMTPTWVDFIRLDRREGQRAGEH